MRSPNEVFTTELKSYIDDLINKQSSGMTIVPVFISLKENFTNDNPNLIDLLLSAISISANVHNISASFKRNEEYENKYKRITYSAKLPLNYILALGLLIPDIEGITIDQKIQSQLIN